MLARQVRSSRREEKSWQRRVLDSLHVVRPWWVAPAVGAAVAACAASLVQTIWVPTRVATARIALDPVAAGAAGAAQEWIATQVALLRSERVAKRVLAEVGAGVLPEYFEFDARGGAARLLSHLRIEAAGQGGLVSIAYRSADAALSARVANAFVTAYDRVSQELRGNVAAATSEGAREQISVLRDEMDQAHARLQAVEDMTNLRSNTPALVEAARVAGLAAEVTWSGLGEDRRPGDQRSALGTAAVAAPEAGFAPGESGTGRLQSARDEYELAQQALVAARARFGELSGEQALSRPAMTLVDVAEAANGEESQRGGWPVVWIAAVAGLAAGLLLRPLAQWIDPRVRNSEDLVSRLGFPVFGALVNAERAAKSAAERRRASRQATTPLPLAVPVLQ